MWAVASAMPLKQKSRATLEHLRLALAAAAQEARQDARAVWRQDGLGMELDALHRQRRVANAHDHSVIGQRADDQVGR